jgi:hypothetical protein
MTLPDIPTSVAFWAGIATLGSAAGAWFTFVATAFNSRRDTNEGIRNLLVGLKVELDFIKQWASGDEGDPGYVRPSDMAELTRAKPDWFNPSRYIFTFESPTLQRFTLSPYVRHLTSVVQPLVRLNYSFRRLLDLHADYRAFATSNPALYASVFKKIKTKPGFPAEEQDYLNVLFDMNLRMHLDLIGGEKSTDQLCLYRAYRSAKEALDQFEANLHPEPLPRWFWILHIFAACLAFDAAWQVLRWFSLLQWPGHTWPAPDKRDYRNVAQSRALQRAAFR